jgi:cytochrome c2
LAAKKGSDLHYHTPTLTRWFALGSVALAVVVVWIILDDHNRQWKAVQQDFTRYDVERTREEIARAEQEIPSAEMDQLLARLDEARAARSDHRRAIRETEQELRQAEDHRYAVEQAWRNAKAYYATARYEYEHALAEDTKEVDEWRAEYDRLTQEVADRTNDLTAATEARDAVQLRLDELNSAVSALEKDVARLEQQVGRLQTKLENIEPWWGSRFLLNEPVLDIMAPTLKIRQVVINDIHQDINYTTIPRVDRCMTCHMAIDRPGYEDAPAPFQNHPDLDLYVGSASPHPMERFGCSTCHFGRDRSVDFARATHTPDSEEEEEHWREEYDWYPPVLWDFPMLPSANIDSTCFKCHKAQDRVPGSARAAEAENFYQVFGCFGCHKAEGYEGLRKVGPSLMNVVAKIPDRDWAYRWIEAPRAFRAKTRMPHFWFVDNNSAPKDVPYNHAEIRGVIEYLYDRSGTIDYGALPGRGDAEHGEYLVRNVGCMACHVVGDDDQDEQLSRLHRRRFGPTLNGIATKSTPEWIYHWIRDPKAYWHDTRMPDLRLTDQEALDITAYLMTLRQDGFMTTPIPEPQVDARDEMLLEFFRARMTDEQAQERLASLSDHDRWVMTGERTIRIYGCSGCHDIPGFEGARPVSIELSEEGSKSLHLFDFGHVHDVPHTRPGWIAQKLANPRIFDRGKVKTRSEYQKMPDFGFSEEEVRIGTTAVLSFVKDEIPEGMRKTLNAREAALEAGRHLVRERNCRGCHELEGKGRDIFPHLVRTFMAEGMSEADATAQAEGFAPPLITVEGAKVEPDWLFQFLQNPSTIRSWMRLRMPTFHFSDEEIDTLITYFNALSEQTYPFQTYPDVHMTAAEQRAANLLVSDEYFNCFACHQRGSGGTALTGSASQWAPNLSLASGRLKPQWIMDWIRNPQAIQPGTRMPTYYDPSSFEDSGPPDVLDGDERAQIELIMKYVINLGGPPPSSAVGADARR